MELAWIEVMPQHLKLVTGMSALMSLKYLQSTRKYVVRALNQEYEFTAPGWEVAKLLALAWFDELLSKVQESVKREQETQKQDQTSLGRSDTWSSDTPGHPIPE